MADKSISQLSPGVAVTDTDLLPNVQVVGVGPVKTTAVQIKTYVNTNPNVTGVIRAQLGSAGAPSYTFDGDTNTGWFSPAADTVAFATAGTERVRINSVGNLGIGGITPSAWSGVGPGVLEINGSAYIASTSQVLSLVANAYYDGTNWIYKTSAAANRYETVFGENRWFVGASGTAGNVITFTQAMTLTAAGDLGIGVTTPSAKLDVVRNGMVAVFGSNSAQNAYVAFKYNSSSLGYIGNGAGVNGGSGATDFGVGSTGSRALTLGTNDTERMRIDSAGNVGIGTTAPSSLLHIRGSSAPEFRIQNETAASTGRIGFYSGSARDASIDIVPQNAILTLDSGRNSSWGGTISFVTDTVERMRINSVGMVGVGTTSPGSRLHVNGTGTTAIARVVNGDGFAGGTNFTTPHFWINSGTDVTGNVTRFAMSVGSGAQVYIDALMESSATVYSSLLFRTRGVDGVAERMRIDSAGNVGIGVAPSSWNASARAIQASTAATFWGLSNNQVYVGSNSAYDIGGTFRYIVTDSATQYRQWQGEHAWFTAASGTAGNAITFTQAMTLNASGNLSIGTTSSNGALTVTKGAAGEEVARFHNSGGFGIRIIPQVGGSGGKTAIRTASGESISIETNTTERMLVDATGNVIVNTAAIATNATDGFLYVSSCAGAPTGTPTAYAGRVPIVVDTTNNKLYFYSGGAWRDAGP